MNSKMKLKKIAEEKNDYENSKINKQRAMWYCLLLQKIEGYLSLGNKACMKIYRVPNVRLARVPMTENTKPELPCKEIKDVLAL